MSWCTTLVVFKALGETKVAECRVEEEADAIVKKWKEEYLRKYPNGTCEAKYYYTILEPMKVLDVYP